MLELLAPAGNEERLKAALTYGADAVYLAGKNYGLRAFSDNFDLKGLASAIKLAHKAGKKVYVTLNIYAYEDDFAGLADYAAELQKMGADAVIVSDAGVFDTVKKAAPNLEIHLSTQANTTNSHAAAFWAAQGAKRIVLARELSLTQIRKIRDKLDDSVELEAFVHGAMCVSYSGRCLLSNFMANRPSNHGECAQSCRWEYFLTEKSRKDEQMPILEDERGTYILNSKDMNMLPFLDKLRDVGVTSFKIEGRMKSVFYVANVVNAYRRALNLLQKGKFDASELKMLTAELSKTSHRNYCTGFYFSQAEQCYETSKPKQAYDMVAVVTGYDPKSQEAEVEQRNRFKVGDELEVLSPGDTLNCTFTVKQMRDSEQNLVTDAIRVQQKLYLLTELQLKAGDILRKKN